ncbi:MAG: hypothetical protein M1828_005372 [Chrysothrix sp. TS-e1954]|nr:MAG: hypothetical protein M1828_005372 [Chrysothrix sp. TS-e1954]
MPLYRRDQENWRNVLPRIYVPDALKLACAFAFTVTCIVQAACSMGVRLTTYLVPFFAINLIAMQAAKRHRSPFPPMSNTYILSALAIATLGFVFAARSEATLHKSTRSRSASDLIGAPKRVIALLLVLFAAQCGFWLTRQRMDPSLHPIQELITSAEDRHAVWFEQAGSSRSLSEAAATYRDRYGGDPPPGYDRWFNYATLNSALVVDDFDSIHEDLLPFWSVKPENIRERTWRLMSNPWNFAGGILIRKGKVSISPQVADTHRWMLEGVQEMIRPFAKWLPDMDIAINMNDECRVAVPFQDMENMREEGRNAFGSSDQKSTTSFSDDRATTWQTIPEEPIDDTDLVEVSLVNSFHHFGSVGCSPSSKARQERHWEVRSQCSSCAAPHSYYQFVDDWIQAASPCHQPDVGDLHGLHASPADFKGSNELLPIFSQSKAVGYNDILYPSAWNYRDKIMYDPNEEFPDPDFLDKDTTLFWRGASSEGRSVGNGAWRGMSRQRLVHLFENATSHDRYMVLLPDAPSETPTYSYHNLAPKDLHVQATTDTRFVDHIERCAHADCDEQAIEFRPEYVQPSEFQSHWRYKYLFDVDGAGFSGRFLPFLASKSLPFKASLMREWWDSRLTPWKHFIPVDIRMTEAWSLLAYFAGWKSPGMGEDEWLMEPHHEEAERIALEGREWVDRVLRKEDMEIYLFRLLLEWGRVTDDARETLGFRADLPEE